MKVGQNHLDVLYESVRLPNTRPTIILRDVQTNEYREQQTKALKLMGESYPHYTVDGGIECYVLEAVAREDWIPDYYVPRLLFWVDKHSLAMQAQIHAQEAAGPLIFQGEALPVQVAAEEKSAVSDQDTSSHPAEATRTVTGADATERYVQKPESPPTILR